MSSEELVLDDSAARRRIVFGAGGEASLSVEQSCDGGAALRAALFRSLRAAASAFRPAVAKRRGSVASYLRLVTNDGVPRPCSSIMLSDESVQSQR